MSVSMVWRERDDGNHTNHGGDGNGDHILDTYYGGNGDSTGDSDGVGGENLT
jgi:hypothetical protein